MAPPVKKCRGCGTAVANPVTCARCDIVAHPGCLKRTGHPSHDGLFLNCGPCLSGTADVDANVISSQSVMPHPTFPTVDELKVIMRDMMRDVVREIIRDEFTIFREEMISSIRSELADLKSKTSDLDGRVRQLEQDFTGSSGLQSTGPLEMDKLMAEMNDWQARAKNIIVHGLPESPNSLPDLSRSHDLEGVRSILGQIQSSDYSDLMLRRLGKRNDSAPRPLCVALNSSEAVINILRGKSRYSGPCNITDDKTRSQVTGEENSGVRRGERGRKEASRGKEKKE